MQELNIIKFIKNIFNNKSLVKNIIISVVTFVILFSILSGVVYIKRAKIFSYFAHEYVKESTENLLSKDGEIGNKIEEKQDIFSQENFVINTVKKTNPAVVSIMISKEVPKYETYIDPNNNIQNPFADLFPGFSFNIPSTPQYRQNGTEKKEIGGGSGFLVSSDGLIVTNKHVVEEKDADYTVFTNDGKKHTAKVIARDPVLDVAILKITGFDFPYLSLGDSDSLEVGQSVIAIGNALAEFRNTVSVGVVSGLARSVTASGSGGSEVLDHVIQTDAAINPGNSGGPLLSLSGKVIGVNVAIVQGSQNIGFALPVNSIKSVINSVKTTGKIVRPYIGIRYVSINSEMKEKNNLSVDYGVLVKSGATSSDLAVIPGSPADKAGIVENDIILEIDGIKLDDKNNLASIVRAKNVGQKINLKILHKGEEKNITLTLETAKDN